MSMLLLFRPRTGTVDPPPNCVSTGSGNTADATFGLPGCADLDEVIFAIIGESSQTANFEAPDTNWTKLISQDADDADGASLNVFWRGGIQPGSGPVTFTRDPIFEGVPWAGGFVVFQGFSTADPIVDYASTFQDTDTPSTLIVEATNELQLVMAAYSAKCDDGTDWTSPVEMTERWDVQYGSDEVGVGFDYEITTAAGNIPPRTASFTPANIHSTNGIWIIGDTGDFGPETTVTWRDLLREAKDPPFDDGVRVVPWPVFIRRTGQD